MHCLGEPRLRPARRQWAHGRMIEHIIASLEDALGQDPPGGPGESHPRAPTERSVKVSLHSARLIHNLMRSRASRPSGANMRGYLSVSLAHHLRAFLNG